MALATQCPHCATTFRVASDQLKLRGGIVRCGACHEIFDGNAALIDLDALAAAKPDEAATAPESAPAEATPEPNTDVAHPAPHETPTSISTVVPAQGSAPPQVTHAEEEHPAQDELATHPVAVFPDEAAQPEPDEISIEATAMEPEQPPAPAEEPLADNEQPATDEAFTTASTVVPAQGSAPPQATPFDVPAATPDLDAEPIYTLDFDSTFNPFGILPKVAAPESIETTAAETKVEPEPELPPAPATVPDLDLRIDEELVAAPLPGDDLHDAEPSVAQPTGEATTAHNPARAPLGSDFPYVPAASIPVRTGPRAKPGRRSKLTPTKIAAPKLRIPETDEPEFVKRSREQEQTSKTRRILMLVVSALLLLALAAQAVVSFRNVWAARYPAAKPALASVCSLLGCRVQLPAQIDNIAIETGELQALGPNAYSLVTQLRNNGDLVQAWPNIELTLNDANDKPLLRRVFTPAEYLGAGARAGTGFGARAEQPVKLYFELDQLKPSGYHIAVFYP